MSHIEDPRQTQAAVRAHQNAKIVDDYATSIMTSLLTLNGAAIGVVLTAVASEKVFTSPMANLLSAGAVLAFGVGICSALHAVLLQRENVAEWRNIWEARAAGLTAPGQESANEAGRRARGSLWTAVVLFLIGATILAGALFTREKQTPSVAGCPQCCSAS